MLAVLFSEKQWKMMLLMMNYAQNYASTNKSIKNLHLLQLLGKH